MGHEWGMVITDKKRSMKPILDKYWHDSTKHKVFVPSTENDITAEHGFDPVEEYRTGCDSDGIPYRLQFKGVTDFCREGYGYVKHKGVWGLWHNPDGKFDGFQVGGNATSWAREAFGGVSTTVGRALRHYEQYVERNLPDWVGQFDEFKRGNAELKDVHDLRLFGKDVTRGQYVSCVQGICLWPVVTADGAWHDVDDLSNEALIKWALEFKDRFMTDPGQHITIVDFHV